MTSLNGWHPGELAIQRKLAFDRASATSWTAISGEMPEQHRTFYTTRLPFIPVTTLDRQGRPWGSILAGREGKPGWAESPRWDRLVMNADVWEGDPFVQNVGDAEREGKKVLIAGIGVEFTTRRRNKFAGWINEIEHNDSAYTIHAVVNEAIGNCPKYINIRDLVPYPSTHPKITYNNSHLDDTSRLPDALIGFIHEADTLFLGSTYQASSPNDIKFPSHLGMNHRGGRPGFVRVSPTDGRTVVLPDYSGNRLMTSLGNIEATPLASLTIPSFTSGAMLYLTGHATNLVGEASHHVMPLQNAVTSIVITGYVFVEDALPVRQRPGTRVERSPYAPPVRFLAEEAKLGSTAYFEDRRMVILASVEIHADDLATFTFEGTGDGEGINPKPGQTAIMDFKSFVGTLPYRHMAPDNPVSVNDDRVRTWTISGCSAWDMPTASAALSSTSISTSPMSPLTAGPTSQASPTPKVTFTLTIRHKPGGAITSALFTIAHKLNEFRPEMLRDTRDLGLSISLVGVGGEFVLDGEGIAESTALTHAPAHSTPASSTPTTPKGLLWIAGGIGITPFLAMLAGAKSKTPYDITLVLSTREPQVLLPLITRAWRKGARHRVALHVFSNQDAPSRENILDDGDEDDGLRISHHQGRIHSRTFTSAVDWGLGDVREREAYVCGPEGFEELVLSALTEAGVDRGKVRREGFVY
ncbi:hypothetical protein BV22DRAFT_1089574 [Leucogyrophana mollusca]|uniref:Uncharacterized protein n=1 Tax=Leucogyrophana mollusca TaxID=85980 RepID=A0ACB8BJX1_9AGAM|nr:hypothetical protein BV22DRAFT_1089574 [Leucogyrophana mollusca]